MTPESRIYPRRLLEIHDPPPALYLRGSLLPEDDLCIAVVGSRSPTSYGRDMAGEIGRDLARRGMTVISGLALGVDAAAHRGALEGGGRTIAVLGSGLDVPYPRRNLRLMGEIAARGALLSEFPLGTEPFASNFPQRNRIIAGMTLGTVVVEATERSGSLITAGQALEEGRDVFAVPGRVTSPESVGTNALIQRCNAKLVFSADDVVAELPGYLRAKLKEDELAPRTDAPGVDRLPADEARVLARIGTDEPVHVDALAREAGLAFGPLLDVLLSLEVRRLIRSVPGGRYLRRRDPGAVPGDRLSPLGGAS